MRVCVAVEAVDMKTYFMEHLRDVAETEDVKRGSHKTLHVRSFVKHRSSAGFAFECRVLAIYPFDQNDKPEIRLHLIGPATSISRMNIYV